MKKLGMYLAVMLVASTVVFAGGKLRKGGKTSTFTGEIMDSQCAGMGTHDPAGYKMTGTTNPKDCTLACVKMEGKFVLYDAAKKATYQLDDQDKPKDFAGQKVKVTGTLDKASNTIHVASVEAQ